MRLVRSTDTTPEKKLRSLLHKLGFRFRVHRKDLPGKPDIVLPKYSALIFVHGCFWHRHKDCPNATMPASRLEYWTAKFKKNVERDRRNQRDLRRLGWKVIVVWECEFRNINRLTEKLSRTLTPPQNPYAADLPQFKIAAESQDAYGNDDDRNKPESPK